MLTGVFKTLVKESSVAFVINKCIMISNNCFLFIGYLTSALRIFVSKTLIVIILEGSFL